MTRYDPEPDEDDNGPWCQTGTTMNRTRHYAHGTTAGAILCTAGACYSATYKWWLVIPGLYVACFLAWCARREYATHRRQQAIAERLARLRRGESVIETPPPCCQFWVHSDGAIHGHDCTRPPAARTSLTLAEQQALAEITAHYDEDAAA